ncbi:MAG: B12-binding domain-containing radical SAM protein [Nitrososphaeria archaeon]
MGYKVLLTADKTLFSEYRNVPLLQFLGCAPVEKVPKFIFDALSPYTELQDGLPIRAPYDVRLVESVLVDALGRDRVKVVVPKNIEEFIDEDTKVVGVSTMDPLGLGPVTMMFTNGGRDTGYTKYYFYQLIRKLNLLRRANGYRFKIVVGGPGTWQLEIRPKAVDELNIDHVVIGETEHVLPQLIDDIVNGSPDRFIKVKGYPTIDQIPLIKGATLHGLLEINRGCGRNCEYCLPNLRSARHLPVDHIVKNIAVNVRYGVTSVWAQSEDVFLYRLEDHRYMNPNWEALIELFHAIVNADGVRHTNPTHGTISAPASNPEKFRKLSETMKAGPNNIIGLQPGLETGSVRLVKKYMSRKALPFSAEEWPDVVFEGTRVLNENYWVPAYTAIVGFPGETDEDVLDTIRLIDRMERELPEKVGEKAHWTVTVLSFDPLANLSDAEFFDVESQLTEMRFYLIYRTWRHTVLETEKFLPMLIKNSLARGLLSRFFAYGAKKVLDALAAWGRARGYDPEKAMTITA